MDAKNALSKTEKPSTTTLEMDDRKPVRSMVKGCISALTIFAIFNGLITMSYIFFHSYTISGYILIGYIVSELF